MVSMLCPFCEELGDPDNHNCGSGGLVVTDNSAVIRTLEQRVEELEAENEKWKTTMQAAITVGGKLETENARLREGLRRALGAVVPIYYREMLRESILGVGDE